MSLTWAPGPSLCLHAAQPRVSCCSLHQHRRVEETNREGRRERQGESVSVHMRETRVGWVSGWVDTARPQLSKDSAPPSFFVLRCSRFPKQVMFVSPLTESTCPALPSEPSECCTASLSDSTTEREVWEQRHHCKWLSHLF